MDGSIKLFSISGIDIRMHLTFPLIVLWGALQFGVFMGLGLPGAAFGVLVTLLLFVIVVLHELGHSYAALAYGIPVRRIVLLPIGGVAELGRLPEKPSQELVIALAGPAVNFALAIVMWLVAQVTPLGAGLADGRWLQFFAARDAGRPACGRLPVHLRRQPVHRPLQSAARLPARRRPGAAGAAGDVAWLRAGDRAGRHHRPGHGMVARAVGAALRQLLHGHPGRLHLHGRQPGGTAGAGQERAGRCARAPGVRAAGGGAGALRAGQPGGRVDLAELPV